MHIQKKKKITWPITNRFAHFVMISSRQALPGKIKDILFDYNNNNYEH